MNEYRMLRILTKKLLSHKKEVESTQNKKYFIGAIILDSRGRIISFGFNSYTKTHPYQKKMSDFVKMDNRNHQIYLHAEISALVKCNQIPHTMIIARIGSSDTIYRCSKPCPICREAIRQSTIKKVFYTNDEGELVLLQ